jgi:hypothetical protein
MPSASPPDLPADHPPAPAAPARPAFGPPEPLGRALAEAVPIRHAHERPPVEHPIAGRAFAFAMPVTFTPFASARACSARCVFCSETLIPADTTRMSASLRPGPGYFDDLDATLAALRPVPLGLSLSGLEATDDAPWLLRLLAALMDHERRGGRWTDRVLYSNGAGLYPGTTGERIVPRLQDLALTRVELSRHADHEAANMAIMRFRPGVLVAEQAIFEDTVRFVSRHLPVRLVCVVQEGGVASVDQVLRYAAWARALGVRDLVFRELSRIHGGYRPTRSLRIVDRRRVPIERLLAPLLARAGHGDLRADAVTVGYYYWNVRFTYAGDTALVLETSDYNVMKQQHRTDVIHKLVFHADGTLAADWDPDRQVILRHGRFP